MWPMRVTGTVRWFTSEWLQTKELSQYERAIRTVGTPKLAPRTVLVGLGSGLVVPCQVPPVWGEEETQPFSARSRSRPTASGRSLGAAAGRSAASADQT